MENITLNIADGAIKFGMVDGKPGYRRSSKINFKPYTGAVTITGKSNNDIISNIIVSEGEHHLILKDLTLSGDCTGLEVRDGGICKVRLEGDVFLKEVYAIEPNTLLRVVKSSQGRLRVGSMRIANNNFEIVYPYDEKENA